MSKVEAYLKQLSSYEEDSCTVIFQNLKGVYPTSQNLPCEFVLKQPSLISVVQCRVSLFPVGWSSFESSISSKDLINLESNISASVVYRCEFDQTELPESNCDEFYQFCLYDYKLKIVHGASCPFQIIEKPDDFCNIYAADYQIKNVTSSTNDMEWWMEPQQSTEFNDDTVLIHNKTTMLEDALAKSVEENDKLKSQKQHLEKTIEVFQQQLTEAENYWRDSNLQKTTLLQEKINQFLDEEKKMKLKLADIENTNLNLTKQIAWYESAQQKNLPLSSKTHDELDKTKSLVAKYKNMVSDQNQFLSQLMQEKDDLKCQLNYVSERNMKLEAENKEIIQRLESKLKLLESNNKKLQSELDEANEARDMQESEICSLKRENEKNKKMWDNDRTLLNLELERLRNETEKLKSENEKLNKIYSKSTEEFLLQVKSSLESSKLEQENQIKQLNEKLAEKEKSLMYMMENEEHLKEKIKSLNLTIEEEQISLREAKELSNEMQKQKSTIGPQMALHSANVHLKRQLLKTMEECKYYQKLYSEVPSDKKDLIKLNNELKYRLEMGKKVFEDKYSECQKLKKEVFELKKKQAEISAVNEETLFQKEAKRKILALQEDLERTRKNEAQLRMDYQKLYEEINLQKKANFLNEQSCPNVLKSSSEQSYPNVLKSSSEQTYSNVWKSSSEQSYPNVLKSSSSEQSYPNVLKRSGSNQLEGIYFPPSAYSSNFLELCSGLSMNNPLIVYPPDMDRIERDSQISLKKVLSEPEPQIMH